MDNPNGNYGFLSRFDCTPEEIEKQVDEMVDVLKINDVQFYDWFANYAGQYQTWDADPKNAFNRAPQPEWWTKDTWVDPYFGGTVSRKDTVLAAVRRVKARGARAWAYVQAVGAEHWTLVDESNKSVTRNTCVPPATVVAGAAFPPVAEYCDGSDGDADPGFFRLLKEDSSEWFVQRSACSLGDRHFPCYLMNKTLAKFQVNAWYGIIFEVFGFSGIHWDTLGHIGGLEPERAGAEEFLHEVRYILDKQTGRREGQATAQQDRGKGRLLQTFNNINIAWWDDVSTPKLFTNDILHFPYTEVWSLEAETMFYACMEKVRAAGWRGSLRPVIANYPEGSNGIDSLDGTWTAEMLVQVRARAAFEKGNRYLVAGNGRRRLITEFFPVTAELDAASEQVIAECGRKGMIGVDLKTEPKKETTWTWLSVLTCRTVATKEDDVRVPAKTNAMA